MINLVRIEYENMFDDEWIFYVPNVYYSSQTEK